MARIDVTQIEGYEGMSVEDKLKALEGFDIPDPDYSGYVKKDLFDKTASELAKAKKELKGKQSEDEQKEADRLAAEQEMKDELDTLRKEKAVSTHKASFLAQGYDEKLADKAAKAMVDGDMNAVFEAMKQHGVDREKAIRTELLKGTPTPPAGKDGDEKSDGVKLAERLGKEAASSAKAANDILAQYK